MHLLEALIGIFEAVGLADNVGWLVKRRRRKR
jgi:hypothetical protein